MRQSPARAALALATVGSRVSAASQTKLPWLGAATTETCIEAISRHSDIPNRFTDRLVVRGVGQSENARWSGVKMRPKTWPE